MLLDLNGATLAKNLPVRVNRTVGRIAGHLLTRERDKQLAQPLGPSTDEVHVVKLADAEQFFIWLKAQRDDEFRIAQLFGEIAGDSDFFLDAVASQGTVAAAQQHFGAASLQGAGNLLAPARPAIEAQDVREHRVALGFQLRRQPQHELVVAGRGLAYEKHGSRGFARGIGRGCLNRSERSHVIA